VTPLVDRLFDALDERVQHRRVGRAASGKIFPLHWSFLIGEVTLVSFMVLLATGLFLTMFYVPSTELTVYEGTSQVHQGRELPAAYESVVRLSHDIDAGLFARRVHRAASHVFIASALLHFLRVVLTGAFTRPREPNYHIGLVLLILAVAAGWIGHNLPYDLMSGTSLRILYAFALSLPWVGDPVAFWIFGGEFPTGQMISRFFAVHVLWLPLAITGLITLHMILVVRQQHTQPPEDGVDGHRTVVGEPLWPWQAVTSTVLALLVVGVLTASAVLVPWSDVDYVGPYRIGAVTNQAQPDWFLLWVEGLLRLAPQFEFAFLGAVWSQVFVVGVAAPLLIVLLFFLYPSIERRVVGGTGETHVLEHPLDVPFRTGMVSATVTFFLVASAAGAHDVIARLMHVPVETVAWALRVLIVVLPVLVGLAATWYARAQPSRWKHRN
jgi:ubiquinol-cytochrome c reductase cytochrome b subunit